MPRSSQSELGCSLVISADSLQSTDPSSIAEISAFAGRFVVRKSMGLKEFGRELSIQVQGIAGPSDGSSKAQYPGMAFVKSREIMRDIPNGDFFLARTVGSTDTTNCSRITKPLSSGGSMKKSFMPLSMVLTERRVERNGSRKFSNDENKLISKRYCTMFAVLSEGILKRTKQDCQG